MRSRLALVVMALTLAGCGWFDGWFGWGGGGGAGGGGPPSGPTPARVIVSPSLASLFTGEFQQFGAIVFDASGTRLPDADVTWTTTDPAFAVVTANGPAQALAVARAAGTTAVTATTGGVSGSAALSVSLSQVARVEVLPPSAVCGLGQSQRFTAVVRDAAGHQLPYALTWASVPSGIAAVDSSGLVTANPATPGLATITATAAGVPGTATFTVVTQPSFTTVATVAVLPSTADIPLGASFAFVAVAKNTAGEQVCESAVPFTWAVGLTSVATVSPTGLVTGIGVGQTNVTATTGGVSGSAALTVRLFRNALTYPAGVAPSAILASDFTGDGWPDLVTANAGGNDVAVLATQLTSTNPFVAVPALSRVGRGPFGVAAGRFHGLGDLLYDLVTADQESDTLSVLLILRDRTFPSGFFTRFAGGPGPVAVVSRDFNSDGLDDLAVVTLGGDDLRLYAQVGTGRFALMSLIATGGAGPIALAAGRFDSDTAWDLAVVNATSGTVTIFLGTGAGGMTRGSTIGTAGLNPTAIAAADFNRDGRLDLAVANRESAAVAILTGDGAGGFIVASTVSSGGVTPTAVAAADFNGDGRQDLAAANFGSNTVVVFLGRGDGTFLAPISHPVRTGPTALAVGDFNGDGRPDLASANAFGNSISVLLAAP